MYNVRIEIDLEACSSCKTCVYSCFVDVLRWDNDGGKPVVTYLEDCVGCFSCEVNCPEQCIKVIPSLPADIPNSV